MAEVRKPEGSATFLKNDSELLWLGLLTRDTGIPASQRLQIQDEVIALSFDLAVSLRLLRFDNEKDAANRRFWVKLITGEDMGGGEDVLNSQVISDPYADANTQRW